MQYLTLPEIKKQLVIDDWFTDDDDFLEMIGDVAESTVSQLMNIDLADYEAEKGELPASVRHALRVCVDYFYSVNRGSSENDKPFPDVIRLLAKLNRNYEN